MAFHSAGNHPVSMQNVQATITHLMSPVGLLIDEVQVEGGPIFINADRPEHSQGYLNFIATVKAESIQVFLENLSPAGLTNFSISITTEGVLISATKVVIVPIPAKAIARLKLDSAQSISVELVSAEALGAGLKTIVSNQLEALNPLVTSDLFPFPVEFREITHHSDVVQIFGRAQFLPDPQA